MVDRGSCCKRRLCRRRQRRRPLACPLPQTTDLPSEEHYARLQAFRDELAGMPVAVQV
jgi:hypothetical protein